VQRRTEDLIEITLAPTGPAPLPVAGGQFAYLRVGDAHEHPFSVAGVDADGSVRLTIRALGRDTGRLYAEVREGVPATLRGPYGMFDHTLGGARQIWVAGGIGIAPFLGWLAGSGDQPARVDLFYCTPSRDGRRSSASSPPSRPANRDCTCIPPSAATAGD
jgi:predicted ferric reductase